MSLMVDILHALFLGPAQRYVLKVVWLLFIHNCFECGQGSNEELDQLSLLRFNHALQLWYKRPEVAARKFTEVRDLTMKKLGTRGKHTLLHFKAAETKSLVYFVVELLTVHWHRIRHGAELLKAGEGLVRYIDRLRTCGARPCDADCNDLWADGNQFLK